MKSLRDQMLENAGIYGLDEDIVTPSYKKSILEKFKLHINVIEKIMLENSKIGFLTGIIGTGFNDIKRFDFRIIKEHFILQGIDISIKEYFENDDYNSQNSTITITSIFYTIY